jgi:hypothetical protein
MDTTPVLTVETGSRMEPVIDPPFVDRVADKVRTLAAVKPALCVLWRTSEDRRAGGKRHRLVPFVSTGGAAIVKGSEASTDHQLLCFTTHGYALRTVRSTAIIISGGITHLTKPVLR